MTYLDSLLLRAAQWLVDRIGDDYIGQRLARHLGIGASLIIIAGYLADYTQTGGWLIFTCVIWALNACAHYWMVGRAMHALYQGFVNPMRDDTTMRLVNVICAALVLVIPSTNMASYAVDVGLPLWTMSLYLMSTDNPPPKVEAPVLKPMLNHS